MKKLATILICILTQATITAQIFPIKLHEVTSKLVDNGYYDHTVGKELNTFKVPDGANSLKMRIQVPVVGYKKITAPYLIRLMVTKTDNNNEENILNSYWNPLRKDSTLFLDCFFPAGNYTINLVDNNDQKVVFATRMITVSPNESKPSFSANGYSYDRNRLKIWTCKSVDNVNWKPIGATNKTSVGGCLTFFFESQEKLKNPGTMRWKLYKVEADGKETFVNQRDQNTVLPEWRRIYYEECDEFRTKGKYRIYYAIKNESEAFYGVKDKDYFATADVIVE